MIIRGLDGWIEIAFPTPPNTAQVRALHWLEDDGLLALERGDGLVRFPDSAWLAAGEIPPESASIEETDEWQRRHDEIARLLAIKQQRVHVNVVGFLLGSDCKLTLEVDGAPLPLEQTRPVFGKKLMLPAVYKAQVELSQARSSWSRDGQVAALGRLKAQLTEAAHLLEGSNVPLGVTFHHHIEDIQVRPVKRAALTWRSAGKTGRLFSLELDEIRDDDSRERLPVEKLSAQAPVISISAKEHLVLPDEMAEVARVAKQHRNQLERNVERDPTLLLPQGYTYDSIDLTAYSDRVLGFETLQGTDGASALETGVAWYRKDADQQVPVVTLQIPDSKGVLREELVAQADVPRLLQEARSALEHDGSVVIQGKHTPATAALVEQLEALSPSPLPTKGDTATPKPPPADEPPQPRQQAAIIREREGSGNTIVALPGTEVPWSVLDRVLQPGIALKEHQRRGIAWLWTHYDAGRTGVLLADDMGLGKTLQVACFLALQHHCGHTDDRSRSTLIVCPKILIANWISEMQRYFRPGAVPRTRELQNAWLRGGDADLLDGSAATFFVVTYDAFARYQRDLLRRHWASAILDESQNIKNPDTYRTRAARGLKRSFGICATGTPIENRLRDLWTQFDFLSPGAPFGAVKDYCARYERAEDGPIRLREALQYPSPSSPLLHRNKREVLQSLPAPIVTVHSLPMTRAQAAEEARIVDRNKEPLKILNALQKLYQHPALLSDMPEVSLTPQAAVAASPKLAKCIEILRGAQQAGEKALVFTLWSHMQSLLRTVLHDAFGLFPVHVVNGASNQSGQSQKILEEFAKRDGFDVLIMSPLAAGAGLNVTAANHVIHYGRWWNPAKEDQATARAHRIGQTRNVSVHYLVLHDPDDPAEGFDRKLHDYVTLKRETAADILSPTEDAGLEQLVQELRRSVAK